MKPTLHTTSLYLTIVLILASSAVAQLSNRTTPSLNVTTTAARDSKTVLQCWSFPGFASSSTAGTSGALALSLGNTTNASYTIIPPRFDGGRHNAPSVQLVYFASGLAHVTLPNTTMGPTTEAWIQGGKYGLILAADTADVSKYGHITTYPSDAVTIGLQVPFAGGVVPYHEVLYDGPCAWSEMAGL